MATERRTPLALVVLALLAEQPMHPYRMFQLITERGKTAIVNITQRNSLYQVIDRLVRSGLAEVETTERSENRPERTVYRITELGSTTVREWIAEMLGGEKPEFPAFPAALSLLAILPPEQVLRSLTQRRTLLTERRDAAAQGIADSLAFGLPPLFLLDDEYRVAMLTAELAWLDGVIGELERGELTWSEEWIAEVSARLEG